MGGVEKQTKETSKKKHDQSKPAAGASLNEVLALFSQLEQSGGTL